MDSAVIVALIAGIGALVAQGYGYIVERRRREAEADTAEVETSVKLVEIAERAAGMYKPLIENLRKDINDLRVSLAQETALRLTLSKELEQTKALLTEAREQIAGLISERNNKDAQIATLSKINTMLEARLTGEGD